jgi:hypothetical protein
MSEASYTKGVVILRRLKADEGSAEETHYLPLAGVARSAGGGLIQLSFIKVVFSDLSPAGGSGSATIVN